MRNRFPSDRSIEGDPMRHSPRALAGIALAGSAALLLTSCGSAGGGAAADPDEPVDLTVTWWGSADRHDATNAALDLFEEEHTNITIERNALGFDGYFDLLSTQFAANDAPDVMQLAVEYIGEYGSRGALLDLADVDTSELDEGAVNAARLDDGLVGVPTGSGAQAVVANQTLFDEAGVALPDDETWTWDDYVELGAELTNKLGNGRWGAGPLGIDGVSFTSYAMAFDEQPIYNAEGEITLTTDAVESYFQLAKDAAAAGATPGGEAASEQTAVPLEQSGSATNQYAMGLWGTAQLPGLVDASGSEMVLLRLPSIDGDAADAGQEIRPPQYWSASSRSKHPAEAQMLIDFLVNSVDAGKLLLNVRGTPANSAVREAILPDLTPAQAAGSEFLDKIAGEVVSDVPLPPAGYGIMQDTLRRYSAEVMFDRQTPAAAAKGFVDERAAAVDSAG
jgi:multiple sugar transport system substrate-binding protein